MYCEADLPETINKHVLLFLLICKKKLTNLTILIVCNIIKKTLLYYSELNLLLIILYLNSINFS